MAMVWIPASLEVAWILGSNTVCLAVGIYTQGARNSHAGRLGSDAGK